MQFTSYSRHQDLYERVVPLAEIETILSSFRLTDSILRICQINTFLAKGRYDQCDDYIQGFLRGNFFDESTINKINEKYAGRVKRIPIFFSRLQMLVLMRICARVCSDSADKRKIDSPEEKKEFGRCCLWITDHLETEDDVKAITEGNEDEARRALAPQIATSLELSRPTNIIHAIARTDIIFSEIVKTPNVIKKCGGFDLFTVFLSATELSIEHFSEFVLFIYAGLEGRSIEELVNDPSLFIWQPQKFISKTKIDLEDFDKLTKLISTPLVSLAQTIAAPIGGSIHKNFTALNSCPMLKLPNGAFTCLDLDYLCEKLNTGIYWMIVDKFSGNDKARAQGMFGYIFEEYVNSIFRHVYPTLPQVLSGHFTESPKYKGTSKEAFDAIYLSRTNPKHLFVLEYKSCSGPQKLDSFSSTK